MCWLTAALFGGVSQAQDAPNFKHLGSAAARRVEVFKAEIERHRREGRFAEALDPARDVLKLCETSLGPDHWRTADASRAIATLETIISLPEEGQKSMALVGPLDERRIVLYGEARYPEAEDLASRCLTISERWLGADHPDTATSLNGLAILLRAQGKPAEAEPLFRRALATRERALGPDHPDTAWSLNNLAVLLWDKGKPAEAEPLFRRALATWERALGPDHLDTARSLNNLAVLLQTQGKLAEAESFHRRALAIKERVLGPDHPDTAISLNNLANLVRAQGRSVEAEPLYRRALASFQRSLGPDHPETASCLHSLAALLWAQGKLAEAEPLDRRALAIRERALGPDHPDTATSLNGLAILLRAQGKPAEAEPLFRRALAIRERALGPDHPDTAWSLNDLAVILLNQGRFAEVGPLFRRALEIRERVLGQDHLDTAITHNNVADFFDLLGRPREAESHHRRALAILERVVGPDHPNTAQSLNSLAVLLLKQGRFAEAEPLLRRALAIRERALGSDHHDTALSLQNIATVLDRQGHLDQAIDCLTRASATSRVSWHSQAATGLDRAQRLNQSPFENLAVCLARLGKAVDAWSSWEENLGHGLLDELSARRLQPLTDEEHRRKATVVGRLQRIDEQIGQLVSMANPTQDEEIRLDDLRRQHSEMRGALVALLNEFNDRYGEYVGRPTGLADVQAAIPPDGALVGWIDLGSDTPNTMSHRLAQYHWACIIPKRGDPVWVRIDGSGLAGDWTEDDLSRPAALRVALETNQPSWRDLAATLAGSRLGPLRPHLEGVKRLIVLPSPALAEVPIEVLVDALPAGALRPIVSYAPSGTMFARLVKQRASDPGPLCLLALGDPAYREPEPETAPPLPPDHGLAAIAILPNSLADLAGIRAGDVLLNYNGIPLRILGDLKLVTAGGTGKSVPVQFWRSGNVHTVHLAAGELGIRFDEKKSAAEVVLAWRAAEATLRPLTRGTSWARLPGTRREVEAISGLFAEGRATLLLGDRATEPALQALAARSELKRYRFLHFAAHGQANRSVAMYSALILAPGPEQSVDLSTALDTDGRITAQQIVGTWDLDADMVVLSACESGLGKYAGGEGYLGFTQALFVKGARSVVLSLWKVDDRATALLMTRFYQNLLGKRSGLPAPLPKAEALNEARRWLRGLSTAEASAASETISRGGVVRIQGKPVESENRPFEHPKFWAGFILVGDPN